MLYDLGPNNNDLIQTVGSKQPIWTVNQQNGKAGILHSATKYMTSTFGSAVNQPYMIFSVAKNTDATYADHKILIDGIASDKRGCIFAYQTAGSLAMVAGATLNSSTAVGTATTLLTALYNSTGSKLWRNGGAVEIASGDAGNQALTGITLGARYDGTFNWTGPSFDHLILNGDDTALKSAIETFFNTKYGVY